MRAQVAENVLTDEENSSVFAQAHAAQAASFHVRHKNSTLKLGP